MKSRLSFDKSGRWSSLMGWRSSSCWGWRTHAGRESGGVSLFDFGNLPSGASGSVMIAALIALGVAAILALAPRQLRRDASAEPH